MVDVITPAQLAQPAQEKVSAAAPWLTVERGLYSVILVLALAVRFWQVGQHPLTPGEASNAWPAWMAAQAVTAPNPPTPTSALLYALHTLLFWITDGGDAAARVIPALAGGGMVLLAWWLRPWLGRTMALLVALLLAFDPWLVALSRLADGAALSLALGLLTLLGLWQIRWSLSPEPVRQRWLTITAPAAGLFVTSGPLAWSLTPVLLLGWLLPSFRIAKNSEAEPTTSSETTTSLVWRTPLLIFVATLVLSATGWLAHPEGIGLISTSLTVWLGHFLQPETTAYPLSWFWLRLIVDELHLVILGGIGLVQLWRRGGESLAGGSQLRLFLTLWLVWGVVLMLLPGRNPLALPMVGLPLLLAAGYALERILQNPLHTAFWREALILFGVLTVLLVAALLWAWALVAQQQFDFGLARGALLFVLLAVVMVVLFALWASWAEARQIVGYYGIMLLALSALSSLWHLNHRVAPDEPDGFWVSVANPDVRRLADAVHTLSAQRTGDATDKPLAVQYQTAPDPVLGWYLREMRNLTWVLAPDGPREGERHAPLVITLDDVVDAPQLADYMGSRYTIRTNWLPSRLLQAGDNIVDPVEADWRTRLNNRWLTELRPLLRWMIYREVRTGTETTPMILWVQRGG